MVTQPKIFSNNQSRAVEGEKFLLPKVAATFIIAADRDNYRPCDQMAQKKAPNRLLQNRLGVASFTGANLAQSSSTEQLFEPIVGVASEVDDGNAILQPAETFGNG